MDADGQCIRSLGTLQRVQRFFLEKCGLKTCLTLTGEDGADLVNEGGRKYSMEVRTNVLLHAIEMRNQQRDAKAVITWPRQWKIILITAL